MNLASGAMAKKVLPSGAIHVSWIPPLVSRILVTSSLAVSITSIKPSLSSSGLTGQIPEYSFFPSRVITAVLGRARTGIFLIIAPVLVSMTVTLCSTRSGTYAVFPSGENSARSEPLIHLILRTTVFCDGSIMSIVPPCWFEAQIEYEPWTAVRKSADPLGHSLGLHGCIAVSPLGLDWGPKFSVK